MDALQTGAHTFAEEEPDRTMNLAHYLRARLSIKYERGAALIEYAFLLALIVMVCILAIGAVGEKTNTRFDRIGSSIN